MSKPLTYKDAGVDIDQGDKLVNQIKSISKTTRRPEVLGGIGGFSALFELPMDKYTRPVLVSSTDGVGTKLRLALDAGVHDTIGIDLVAMVVNDLIVVGAEPLFLLDYYACSALDVEVARAVISGINRGCEIAGCSLVGGETAEMPGFYARGDYDVAGFAVGVVEKSLLVDGQRVRPGDALIALASSGPHSNGFSLIRHILAQEAVSLEEPLAHQSLGAHLLAPTRIYVAAVLALHRRGDLLAAAHITGGGLMENIPRVLPAGVKAVIHRDSWTMPAIFQWLQAKGPIAAHEMLRTFNCGVGMVVCVPQAHCTEILSLLGAMGESVWQIGHIEAHTGAPVVEIRGA